MTQKPAKGLAAKIGDKLDFAKSLISQPKTLGAIAPSSARMAKIMASVINVESGLPVLELGPGTGVITKAILDTGISADKVYSVEYDSCFLAGLNRRYPGVNFLQGDAFRISQIAKELGIEQFDCVISALPLLNFSPAQRLKLVKNALKLIGNERPMVQFSYGRRPPVPARPKYFSVVHMDSVFRNIPPARIWTYQRSGT
ncbi:MAG: methyltransferase domain-containing protein [Rhizobiaceae bacterium]|nr:methyltransferase domain-containing protein [Rhizobiaceae bacterium]